MLFILLIYFDLWIHILGIFMLFVFWITSLHSFTRSLPNYLVRPVGNFPRINQLNVHLIVVYIAVFPLL